MRHILWSAIMVTPRMRVATSLIVLLLSLGAPATADDEVEWANAVVETVNQLKHLDLALHNYHDTHKSFPAAAIYHDGKPMLSSHVAHAALFRRGRQESVR